MIFIKKSKIIIPFLFFFITIILSFQNGNTNNSFEYPTDTKDISSYYGYREIFGSISFHNGIDFPLPKDSKVYASLSGTVSFKGFLNGYGNTIILSHTNDFKSLYGHLDSNFLVKEGQYVTTHEIIGYVGPKYLENGILNGYTTGPHLHFSIFDINSNTIDPLTLLK